MEEVDRLYLEGEGKTAFITDFPVGGTGTRDVNHTAEEDVSFMVRNELKYK
jgi:hypothetical protein